MNPPQQPPGMVSNVFYCNGQLYSFVPANGQQAPSNYPPAIPPNVAPPTFAMAPPAPPPAAPPGPAQNKGLVADLCKIIERQSQEIASLVQNRPGSSAAAAAVTPQLDGPKSPGVAAPAKMSGEMVEYTMEGEVRAPPRRVFVFCAAKSAGAHRMR